MSKLRHTPNFTIEPFNQGIAHKFLFENGYGGSVIRHDFSYGGAEGLWEMAVITHNVPSDRLASFVKADPTKAIDPPVDVSTELIYDTPVMNDVMGHLTPEQVEGFLDQIKALEKRANYE